MGAPSKRTTARTKRLLELHKTGASTIAIGEEIGVSPRTISAWLRELKLEPNGGHGPRDKRFQEKAHAKLDPRKQIARDVQRVAATLKEPVSPVPEQGLPVLQRRLAEVSELADRARDFAKEGDGSAEFRALVKMEADLARDIEDMTPKEAPDPEKDPANLEAANETSERLERMVVDTERALACAHCGKKPFTT